MLSEDGIMPNPQVSKDHLLSKISNLHNYDPKPEYLVS